MGVPKHAPSALPEAVAPTTVPPACVVHVKGAVLTVTGVALQGASFKGGGGGGLIQTLNVLVWPVVPVYE